MDLSRHLWLDAALNRVEHVGSAARIGRVDEPQLGREERVSNRQFVAPKTMKTPLHLGVW